MKTPIRLQLSRRRGFRLQAQSLAINGLPAVRCCRPGPFGNPFKVTGVSDPGNLQCATAKEAVERFRDERLVKGSDGGFIKHVLPELRGKNLACFCAVWECANGHKHGHDHQLKTKRVPRYCSECGAPLTRVHCHVDLLLEAANA